MFKNASDFVLIKLMPLLPACLKALMVKGFSIQDSLTGRT